MCSIVKGSPFLTSFFPRAKLFRSVKETVKKAVGRKVRGTGHADGHGEKYGQKTNGGLVCRSDRFRAHGMQHRGESRGGGLMSASQFQAEQ